MTENMALIVDDSRVARITLKKLLVAQGFAISENSSGEEALTFLNEAEQLPAVIFMDVMMDGMDGLETTRQIKQDQRYAQIPVVMCTGHDSETEIENAMTTGAVAVLSKPPQEAQLLTVLEAVKQAQVVKNLTEQVEASDVIAAPIDEQAIIDKVSLVVNEQLNATVQQAVNDAVAEIHAAEVQQAELDYAQIAEQVAVQLSDVTETKAQQAAQETSRQTASEVVTEQLEQALQTQLDGMLPDLQAQLAEQLVAGVNETVAETVKAQAEQVVTQQVDALKLKEKVNKLVSAVAASWLQQHQPQILKAVLTAITKQLPSLIDKQVEKKLPDMVAPLIDEAVQSALPETDNEQDESAQQLEQMAKRLSMLNAIVLGLSVVVIGLVAFNFI